MIEADESKKPPSTMNTLLHVTRQDGEVVEVAKELFFTGHIEVFIGDDFVGVCKEYRVDNPIWRKKP